VNNENDGLCVFKKKISKISISNTLSKTTKGTKVYTCWQVFVTHLCRMWRQPH